MLRTLLESQARSTRRAGGTLISVTLHTALIALAVAATARARSAPPPRPRPNTLIYVAPPRQIIDVVPQAPPGKGLPTLPVVRPVAIAPLKIPTGLPPIDFTRPPAGEPAAGTWTPGALTPPGSSGAIVPRDGIFTLSAVEEAVAPLPGNPAPVYPSALRAAQIQGTVLARFVVDTAGRAEPESITFLEATHGQFADAVRQALVRSRFHPARIGGHPVRQLVEQRFAFTLVR